MMKKFGEGIFLERNKRYKGNIIIDNYKIYLEGNEPFVDTFIPLEKINLVKRKKTEIIVYIKPTSISRRIVAISGKNKVIADILHTLIEKLNLKKRFLRSIWIGRPAFK